MPLLEPRPSQEVTVPFPKTEADPLADTYAYPATRVPVPKHPWPMAPEPGPDLAPDEYRLPDFYVYGMVAGRSVRLKLVLQEDATAYEAQLVNWLVTGEVKGNLMACVVDRGLARHFVEDGPGVDDPAATPAVQVVRPGTLTMARLQQAIDLIPGFKYPR
jgi:hypothetical protein